MHLVDVSYNLQVLTFCQVEREILKRFKSRLEKYGIVCYDDLPSRDRIRLLNYYTFTTLCRTYQLLPNRRNVIFWVDRNNTNEEILSFVLKFKKVFPILLYITTEPFIIKDNGAKVEITLKIKEFRYSLDYSKFSFEKIKRFCKKFQFENFFNEFKF